MSKNEIQLKYKCFMVRSKLELSQKLFAKLIDSNQTEISFIERGFIPEDKQKIYMIDKLYKKICEDTLEV